MNDNFFKGVAVIIEQARVHVGRTADLTMCITYFEIGRMIVEQEQHGRKRAEYGRGLLAELSKYLTERFGRGFSVQNLKNFRQFYMTYSPAIAQTVSAQLEKPKRQSLIAESGLSPIRQSLIGESLPFRLSWTHYLVLIRIQNDSVVELTLPENSNVYASEYALYLPDKTLLQRKLTEWAEEFETQNCVGIPAKY